MIEWEELVRERVSRYKREKSGVIQANLNDVQAELHYVLVAGTVITGSSVHLQGIAAKGKSLVITLACTKSIV